MENHRRSTELPDIMIQHIQSFLEPIEAAQTMLVSKSWLRAWSTFPSLVFDTSKLLWRKNKYENIYHVTYENIYHVTCKVIDRALESYDRALESYDQRGITIARLQLVGVVKERWLKMAQQCNVVELRLGVGYDYWTDSTIQQIFLAESVQVLSLACQELCFLSNINVIKCLNLKELRFYDMLIDAVTFELIVSSCTLIEELLLANCSFMDSPSCNLGVQSFMFAGECKSLKRLSLIKTIINDEMLQTILCKSPQLEDFNLIGCSRMPVKPISLSSVTLKRVNLDGSNVKSVIIDAPNLHKLEYRSCSSVTTPFPVTIMSPIKIGTVKVTIECNSRDLDESWFHRLGELLAKVSKSNVTFFLGYAVPLWSNLKVPRLTPLLPLNEVDTLRFKAYKELAYIYAFFSICHPKIVLLERMDTMSEWKFRKEVLKDISYRGNLECCNFNDKNKCWRHYLKDAKFYYVVDNEKKPLDVNRLERGCGNPKVITLVLEWESSD